MRGSTSSKRIRGRLFPLPLRAWEVTGFMGIRVALRRAAVRPSPAGARGPALGWAPRRVPLAPGCGGPGDRRRELTAPAV